MPRRIIFHARFQKTGTSTVQAVLRENRKVLMPHLAIRLKGQMQELIHATRGYSTYRTQQALDKVTTRFAGLLKNLPGMPKRTLVFSAEELSGHMPGRGDLADYSAAPILLYAFWEQARATFPDAEIGIYLTTRDANPWLRSAWAEHVKSSAMRLDFDAFKAQYGAAGDLQAVVSNIAARVPCKVTQTSLESCADLPLGPADPLLDLCDIPLALRAELATVPRANVRLSDPVLAALLEANRSYEDRDARTAAKAAILGAHS